MKKYLVLLIVIIISFASCSNPKIVLQDTDGKFYEARVAPVVDIPAVGKYITVFRPEGFMRLEDVYIFNGSSLRISDTSRVFGLIKTSIVRGKVVSIDI